MSGHSHFHSIKHKKELEDKKRSKIFSKISRLITVAAKEGGGDPENNPRLRLAIEQAKSANMPKDNIERAIKRGTGELEGEKLEEFLFEAYGPGGIAIIIEGITDNRTRTLNEVKQILNQKGGKLANEGSVKWLFERKGEIIINTKQDNEEEREKVEEKERNKITKEDLEMIAIESGAEDFHWQDDLFIISTTPEKLEEVKDNLKEKGLKIESSSLGWSAKEEIPTNEEIKKTCQALFEALDENDDIQEIYSNLRIN